MFYTLDITTSNKIEFLDITEKIQDIIKKSKIYKGICTIYIPHTTAGVTINENADPTVKEDMIKELNKIIPFNDGYKHVEGNSSAHIKSSLVGISETIIIEKNKLVLGTWQGIYFSEFDGPRKRSINIKIIEE